MKRPLAIWGITALAALVLSVFTNTAIRITLGVICIAVAFLLAVIYKRRIFKDYTIILVALLVTPLMFFAYELAQKNLVEPYISLVDNEAQVTAKVLSYDQPKYNRHYYNVQVIEAKTDSGSVYSGFDTRISSANLLDLAPGDEIRLRAAFYAFQEKYGFSSQNSYAAKGFPIGCRCIIGTDADIVKGVYSGVKITFAKIGYALTNAVKSLFPADEAGLVSAMLLGDRSGVSEKIEQDFSKSGVTHLIVVSGLHMSMIAAIILAVLGALRVPKKPRYIVAILLIIIYMLITGLSVSVMRSGIMMIFVLIAGLIGRENDSLNALGGAVILICLLNPLIGGDIGFLLSVLSTLGIILLNRPVMAAILRPFAKAGKGILDSILSSLSVGISAVIFILPLQIYIFGTFSVISPIVTLILTIPCTLVIYIAIIALGINMIPFIGVLAKPFAYLGTLCCRFIFFVVDMAARLDAFTLRLGLNHVLIPLCGVLCIAAALFLIRPTKRVKIIAAALSVLLIFSGVITYNVKYSKAVTLLVPHSVRSSAAVLAKDGSAVVISLGGSNENVMNALKESGANRVEALIFAGDDVNSQEMLMEVLGEYAVSTLYCSKELYISPQEKELLSETEIIPCDIETEFTVFGDMKISRDYTGLVSFDIFYKKIALTAGIGRAVSCDVLVATNPKNIVNSSFTVLQTNDILINEIPKSGEYIFTNENKVTFLDFFKSGKMEIRGEN